MFWCRDMPSIRCTIHRAQDSDRDNLHWNTRRLLLSSQRPHLPPLRHNQRQPTFPNPPLSPPGFKQLPGILPVMEAPSAMVVPAIIRLLNRLLHRPLPLLCPLRPPAGELVGASHAVAGGGVHLPQCVLDDNVESESV